MTQPLRIIQERMSKVKFGKRNEQIEWRGKDEIGDLITEYNRMVAELTDSAQKLAQSERESAWREMAKQVAHEIKNPLTPMKLSVQHLQRAWKDQHVNLNEIMQRFTQTLVEQIDTLSSIATEFSNFAQMPKANYEIVDLRSIVGNIVNLYRENEKVHIHLEEERKIPYEVYADRDQMLRVFTNLVKNSVQAIPDSREGKIEVKLFSENSHCVVAVKDNGNGIPNDKISKIFTPNFTTKTGGTGLGLAMVKSIVENSNGKIWFETAHEKGTTFYVSLPVYESQD
jgi:nitrogen fixation/metabolism regulation signal transduction histidine kinase